MPPQSVVVGESELLDVSDLEAKSEGLLRTYELTWIESMAVRILKHGKIPRHLAVIMDGNRRYARLHEETAIFGHRQGFEKLSEVLFWCRQLGINEVTVYAFSIENFNRPTDEVDALMRLAEDKFVEILENQDRLEEEGVCIRILGDTSHLPLSLQKVCVRLVRATKHYTRCFLNIALSYTSREEMSKAIDNLIAGVESQVIEMEHLNESMVSSAMYSRASPDPDLLLRTSGEVRLSDFLLWQTGFTVVEFFSALWPNITIWQFFGAILQFQWQTQKITSCLKDESPERGTTSKDEGLVETTTKFNGFLDDRQAVEFTQICERSLSTCTWRKRLALR